MALEIAQLGQPILREVAQPVPAEEIKTPEFQSFVEEMIATMKEERGVGLAGPQVFRGQRIFAAAILPPAGPEQPPRTEVFINPRLVNLSEAKVAEWEGCLSFRELMVLVPRHRKLRVEYLDRYGTARALEVSGYPARVVQHEYDHLDGILTIDRAVSTRDIVKTSEIETVLKQLEEQEAAAESDTPKG